MSEPNKFLPYGVIAGEIISIGVSVIIGVLVGTSEGDGEGVTVELTT